MNKVDNGNAETSMQPIREIMKSAFSTISQRYESRGEPTVLTTGYECLDNITGGIRSAELFVIAGQRCVGKTALVTNIAERIARKYEKTVAIFSLGKPSVNLVLRMISSIGRVDMVRLDSGRLIDEDWPRIAHAICELGESKLCIDDSVSLSVSEIRESLCLFGFEDLAAIVVDGFQQMRVSTPVATILGNVMGLKVLAHELNIPVIVTTELSNDKPCVASSQQPRSKDWTALYVLKDKADTLVFLNQPDHVGLNSERRLRELVVEKQPGRKCGEIAKLVFLSKYLRFEEFTDEFTEEFVDSVSA